MVLDLVDRRPLNAEHLLDSTRDGVLVKPIGVRADGLNDGAIYAAIAPH